MYNIQHKINLVYVLTFPSISTVILWETHNGKAAILGSHVYSGLEIEELYRHMTFVS